MPTKRSLTTVSNDGFLGRFLKEFQSEEQAKALLFVEAPLSILKQCFSILMFCHDSALHLALTFKIIAKED